MQALVGQRGDQLALTAKHFKVFRPKSRHDSPGICAPDLLQGYMFSLTLGQREVHFGMATKCRWLNQSWRALRRHRPGNDQKGNQACHFFRALTRKAPAVLRVRRKLLMTCAERRKALIKCQTGTVKEEVSL